MIIVHSFPTNLILGLRKNDQINVVFLLGKSVRCSWESGLVPHDQWPCLIKRENLLHLLLETSPGCFMLNGFSTFSWCPQIVYWQTVNWTWNCFLTSLQGYCVGPYSFVFNCADPLSVEEEMSCAVIGSVCFTLTICDQHTGWSRVSIFMSWSNVSLTNIFVKWLTFNNGFDQDILVKY